MDADKAAPLLAWIQERENIRKAKEADVPRPWTQDKILDKYRFCNVRRKHDRVSRWLLEHVLTAKNLHTAGENSFIMFTALCRWVNWPPSIRRLVYGDLSSLCPGKAVWPNKRIDWTELKRSLNERRASKEKVWTGAYIVTAAGAEPGQTKVDFVVDNVLREGVGKVLPQIKAALKTNSRQAVWEVLQERNNWGSFMAGQVIDDWTWTPLLWKASDNYSWAPQGPGSKKGLNKLLGRNLHQGFSQEEWCLTLYELRVLMIAELGLDYRSVTLHDMQNCLCEYFKYAKVRDGEGKPRSMYRPESEYHV